MEKQMNTNTKTNPQGLEAVEGELKLTREKARKELAKLLLWITAAVIVITILTGSVLLYLLPAETFVFRDMLTLVLAVASIFSGILGSAITFYFMSKE